MCQNTRWTHLKPREEWARLTVILWAYVSICRLWHRHVPTHITHAHISHTQTYTTNKIKIVKQSEKVFWKGLYLGTIWEQGSKIRHSQERKKPGRTQQYVLKWEENGHRIILRATVTYSNSSTQATNIKMKHTRRGMKLAPRTIFNSMWPQPPPCGEEKGLVAMFEF